ncbi:MAG: hypothetical protein AVDCRST_MAG28-3878, partial [uncultured Rubrobacteraceae bacterium]
VVRRWRRRASRLRPGTAVPSPHLIRAPDRVRYLGHAHGRLVRPLTPQLRRSHPPDGRSQCPSRKCRTLGWYSRSLHPARPSLQAPVHLHLRGERLLHPDLRALVLTWRSLCSRWHLRV